MATILFWPQCVKVHHSNCITYSLWPIHAKQLHWSGSTLAQVMASCLTPPLEPMLTYREICSLAFIVEKFYIHLFNSIFISKQHPRMTWKCSYIPASGPCLLSTTALFRAILSKLWGGWGCEVSCGGHHRPKGKTTTGSALDGAVFDTTQILAYLVHNMSGSQLYLGFGHFGWLPSFFGQ